MAVGVGAPLDILPHYRLTTVCEGNDVLIQPGLLSISDEALGSPCAGGGELPEGHACSDQRCFRLFAAHLNESPTQANRVQQSDEHHQGCFDPFKSPFGCDPVAIGTQLAHANSVLVDVHNFWEGGQCIGLNRRRFVGGVGRFDIVDSCSGQACGTFANAALGIVGQMAIDSTHPPAVSRCRCRFAGPI